MVIVFGLANFSIGEALTVMFFPLLEFNVVLCNEAIKILFIKPIKQEFLFTRSKATTFSNIIISSYNKRQKRLSHKKVETKRAR